MIEGPSIYLDTNVFIDFIEGGNDLSEPIDVLMATLRKKPGTAVASELTLAEVLSPTKGRKRHPLNRRLYLDLLVWSRFIDLRPVTRGVLYETANLRATRATARLKLVDAIHLATAILSGCQMFISRDRGIPMPSGMQRIEANHASITSVLERIQ